MMTCRFTHENLVHNVTTLVQSLFARTGIRLHFIVPLSTWKTRQTTQSAPYHWLPCKFRWRKTPSLGNYNLHLLSERIVPVILPFMHSSAALQVRKIEQTNRCNLHHHSTFFSWFNSQYGDLVSSKFFPGLKLYQLVFCISNTFSGKPTCTMPCGTMEPTLFFFFLNCSSDILIFFLRRFSWVGCHNVRGGCSGGVDWCIISS